MDLAERRDKIIKEQRKWIKGMLKFLETDIRNNEISDDIKLEELIEEGKKVLHSEKWEGQGD